MGKVKEKRDFKVDVWAAGVILYFMCSKEYPYDEYYLKGEDAIEEIKSKLRNSDIRHE